MNVAVTTISGAMTKSTSDKEVLINMVAGYLINEEVFSWLVNILASRKLIPLFTVQNIQVKLNFLKSDLCQGKKLELQKSSDLSACGRQCYSVLSVTLCWVSG